MIDKIWFFIMGFVVSLIFNIIIGIILTTRESKETKNTDANKCNVDLSNISENLDKMYNEIINMDLKLSQTNKLMSYIFTMEHEIHQLEGKDKWIKIQ